MKATHGVVTALVLSALAFVLLIDEVRADTSTPRDLSRIVVVPPGRTPENNGVSQCSGLQAYAESLRDTGLSAPELAKGVNCVVADFDANGYLDFAIWGALEPSKRGLRGTRRIKVLFFRGRAVVRSETIVQEDYDQALLWARGSGHDGACDVARHQKDGVKLPGEGGGTWFYAYDPASRRLHGQFVCDE